MVFSAQESTAGGRVVFEIHPDNPKIFEFRGESRVLVCATEHYGAVLNRPFRFERYLEDAAARGQTLTRLFTLFRELQTAVNPYSTCKPDSTDYVAPFRRVGPEKALDFMPKYDLTQWNEEFFGRLHRFLTAASKHRTIVEVVLLSNTYSPDVWALNPLNTGNNVNDVEEIQWPDYTTTRHPKLFEWQCAHVRKIVQETNQYDNIFYEICNEPGGGFNMPDAPSVEEVNAWQVALADVIKETESRLPRTHLIAGQEAFTYSPEFDMPCDETFRGFPVDIVNVHPSPYASYAGKHYDMGAFMGKELKLQAIRDFALATYDEKKPLNYDEDNTATMYRDVDAWIIHRKRAWTALFSGAHYDMIDFAIVPHVEAGTVEAQEHLRAWMKHLSEFIHALDLRRARPLRDLIRGGPGHVVDSAFGVPGEDICVYLADDRELGDEGLGESISGSLEIDLPEKPYQLSFFAPVTGRYETGGSLRGARHQRLPLPPFRHDIVLRLEASGR